MNSGKGNPFSSIDVVVLAGGLGLRARPAVGDLPKVLATVAGKPFLTHLFDQLAAAGARRVILALGHGAAQVETALSEFVQPLEVVISREAKQMGTGGALRQALPRIFSSTVLVMNGDSFVRAPLTDFVANHWNVHARASLIAARVDDVSDFGALRIDAQGVITGFSEKGGRGAGYINAGIYLFSRNDIEAIAKGDAVSLEYEVLPGLCGQGFYAFKGDFPVIDIGTPERLARADAFFSER